MKFHLRLFLLNSLLPLCLTLPPSRRVSPSKGTVSVLMNHGMMVHLSDNIKGLVPRTHLSDIVLKNPEKKYVEGMKIKCRVSHRPVRTDKSFQMQLKLV